MLLAVGGQSPNDVQHLAHEVWNAAKPGVLTSRELGAALLKILGDITPMAEAWIEKLTRNQTRALLATALHEELGSQRRLSSPLPALPIAAAEFDYIGSDTIQRVNAEFATRRRQFKKAKLRWRVSRGARRSLGWVPFRSRATAA